MSPLGPPKAHTCMQHTCHLRLAKWLFQFFYYFFIRFCKNVLPAAVGSTFLKSGSKHFTPFYTKKLMFWTPKRHENEALWSLSAPLEFKKTSQKCVLFVYEPTWAPQSPHTYASYLRFQACEAIFDDFYRFFMIFWWFFTICSWLFDDFSLIFHDFLMRFLALFMIVRWVLI